MRRPYLALLCLIAIGRAAAEEPPHSTFSPQPPGTVVESRLVYLAGEAMHAQWRAVLSKSVISKSNGVAFYQWYLSLYEIDGTVYRLKYRSPDAAVPFERIGKEPQAPLSPTIQDGKISGVGELMGPGAQQLVVQSAQRGSDCGNARVDVFFFDAAMKMVTTTLSVENACDLSARVIHEATGDALELRGPYYKNGREGLCCPAEPHATAIVRFHNGTWTERPNYFAIVKNGM